jgi:hypothetical protein
MLDALGANNDGHAVRQMRRENFKDWPQHLGGDHGENEFRVLGFGRVRGGADIREERHAREIPRIDSGGGHLGDMRGVARPKRHFGLNRAARPGREIGERRAPGTGTENSDPAFAVGWHETASSIARLLPFRLVIFYGRMATFNLHNRK